MPRRCGRSAFLAFIGNRAGSPVTKPRHSLATGQVPHDGDFGRHTVAPKSISACAQSPGRSSVTNSPANRLSSGLAAGTGVSTANRRAMTRSTLPSTTLAARSKAMEATAAAV